MNAAKRPPPGSPGWLATAPLPSPEEMAAKQCGPHLLEPARSGWIADRAAGLRVRDAAWLQRLDAIANIRDDGECFACLTALRAKARAALLAEDAPALCPCGDRLATMAGYCDECRADAHDPGEP